MTDRKTRKHRRGQAHSNSDGQPDPTRRRLLTGMVAGAGALALGGCGEGGDSASAAGVANETASLPAPSNSGIEHFVVLMMENRSFDHMLGWLPGADGLQPNRQYPDRQGQLHTPFHLTDPQNCGNADPGHDMKAGRQEYNNGKLDGFLTELRNGDGDLFPIGYYKANDLTFLGKAVPAWTGFDRYFAATLSQTYPNRFYMHAAQTDRLSNYIKPFSTLPTIWDRLEEKGLTRRYYFNNLPFTALWGQRFQDITFNFDQFLKDARNGNLPQVSFVDPVFTVGGKLGNSDHPLDDIRSGEFFMNRVYNAIVNSPNWRNTVFVINYDEWGGFFDHVAPPLKPIPEAEKKAANTKPPEGEGDFRQFVDGRLGFRTPTLLVSPLARRGYVSHMEFDHTSILKMIEWRFGLRPLSIRDKIANNMAHALDFDSPKNLSAPAFDVPAGTHEGGVFARTCPTSELQETDFVKIYHAAKQMGFRVEAR